MSEQLMFSVLPPQVERRLRDLRPETLGPSVQAVLAILAHPVFPAAGMNRAVSISAMQAEWRRTGQTVWSDRTVKAAAKELLEEHEVPVGSSRRANASGYFLICDAEDIRAAERPLRGEILSLARRLRVINPDSVIARQIHGQLGMEATL